MDRLFESTVAMGIGIIAATVRWAATWRYQVVRLMLEPHWPALI